MDYVKLTEEEKKVVLSGLDPKEIGSLPFAESILQKIAGVYINKPGYHPEMADFYRYAASTLSDLRMEL